MASSSRSASTAAKPYHHGNLREELLELALADLESTGSATLSLRDLAARAGVSKTAPYRHFPDRDSLLTALMDHGWKDLHDATARAQDAASDPLAGLRAMGRAYLAFALARPGMYRLLFSGEGKSLATGLVCPDAHNSYRLLEAQVALCQSAGWRPDANGQFLTLAVWSLVHGAADLALENLVLTPPGLSPLEFWSSVVDFVEPPAARGNARTTPLRKASPGPAKVRPSRRP